MQRVPRYAKAILLRIPRICNPRGILRETFIKEEIQQKYAEYGYGQGCHFSPRCFAVTTL
jgi:hypothetical protein